METDWPTGPFTIGKVFDVFPPMVWASFLEGAKPRISEQLAGEGGDKEGESCPWKIDRGRIVTPRMVSIECQRKSSKPSLDRIVR